MNQSLIHIGRAVRVTLAIVGLALSVTAIGAELLNLDFTPGFGLVQMFQLLVGITLLTIVGYWQLWTMRPDDAPPSLQADIGVRLGLTGLVFAVISGLSDLLQIGTHLQPRFENAYVGPLQLIGLFVGCGMIVVGMWLYHTSRGRQPASSLEFLLQVSDESAAETETAPDETPAATPEA